MDAVFLIARPRSGTTVLRDLVAQSNLVAVMPEVFHSQYVDTEGFFFNHYRKLVRDNPDLAMPSDENRRAVFDDYVNTLINKFSSISKNKKSLMLTLNYNSLHCLNTFWQNIYDVPNLINLIRKGGSRVIHLVRRNVFETLVSEARAKQTGVWHLTGDDSRNALDLEKKKKVRLDVNNLVRELTFREMEIELIGQYLKKHMPNRTLEVIYEDLFPEGAEEASAQELARIGSFLEISEPLQPITKFRKTRSAYEDTVSNYVDVANALRGTPFARML